MNTRHNMIIAKGKIITPDVIFYKYNKQTKKIDIKFKNGKYFSYNYNSVVWLKDPKKLNPANYRIMHNEKELFDITEIYLFYNGSNRYWHICFKSGKEQDYDDFSLTIDISSLKDKKAGKIFDYLKETASLVSICAEDGTKILSKQYDKISYVANEIALSTYINPVINQAKILGTFTPIFPFGCNASQFKAVKNALENQISVIQGPPGTGKTQTILNILANLIITGKTVQVVSNNNSATENIMEKLSSAEYHMGFLVAPLGNSQNKSSFIQNQDGKYPQILKSWGDNISVSNYFFENVKRRSNQLNEIFEKKELLALAKNELQDIKVEFKHFNEYYKNTCDDIPEILIPCKIKTDQVFDILNECQNIIDNGKNISLFFKIKYSFIYRIFKWSDYNKNISDILTSIKHLFYIKKLEDLNKKILNLKDYLELINDSELLKDFTDISMNYLKAKLFSRFGNKSERKIFCDEDLWKNYTEVLKEYPVILSTTYSARSSLCHKAEFDYLIMDEASQVDVATGALALSCAKNAVIVGDSKQLPNVIKSGNKIKLQQIFNSFNLSQDYNFTENSFLQSVCNVLPHAPQTLLREHYRCHPKIINFCNKKYYENKLIIMTEDNGEDNAISIIKTTAGNHERDRMNQRQIDVVKKNILEDIKYHDEDIGIIAPYKNQVNSIREALYDKQIDVATVHKFQGREKDAIIITTVDDKVTDFSDDPYLLNVAVSRAKKSLYIVVSGNEQPKDSNIYDLIEYIKYNNIDIKESNIYSVFDLLYRQYTENRLKYLKNHKKISQYDSENLMYVLIKEVISNKKYSSLNVICHQPLNMLIRDSSLMNEEESKYAMHHSTHLDFLIYNHINKKPVLAIEVDGFHYHKKGTLQSERDKKKDRILNLYKIPFIRFATNGSGEKELLNAKLKDLVS